MSYYFDRQKSKKPLEYETIRRRSQLGAPFVFAIVIVAIIFVMSVFFRVRNIEVNGNTHYTDAEIISAIDIEDGDNLFFFDRFAALSRVFAKLPYIEEVSISRSLPDRVVINVVECRALAYIAVGDEKWTIDHNCKVLGKATGDEADALIAVEGFDPGTLLIGEDLTSKNGGEETVQFLSEVLMQIQDRGLAIGVKSVNFSNTKRASFTYHDKYTVVIGNSENVEHKFGMLMSVFTQLQPGDYGTIDVSDGSTAHFRPL